MRIAVIGGGTAGHLAAAHVTHHWPDARLYHVFDRRIPAIGVGEGTLPQFPAWIDRVTGLPFEELEKRCLATLKLGVRFENWGQRRPLFFNNFSRRAFAYHLSALRLPQLLAKRIRAERLDQRVLNLNRRRRSAVLNLGSGESLTVDFVFDARGFPDPGCGDCHEIPGIPTNAALVRRGPAGAWLGGTRAIARPHGWIFAIPLTSHVSYGYVHHTGVSPLDAVRSDFDDFFREEETAFRERERLIRFPNFRRKTFFDGSILRIGNAASFIEPLEATAIGVILQQLQVAAYWLNDEFQGISPERKWDAAVLGEINRHLGESVDALGLFVAWHYIRGSAYDTRFWRQARAGSRTALRKAQESRVGRAFQRLVEAAQGFSPSWLSRVRDPHWYDTVIAPSLRLKESLAGFDEVSFAQIGHGLGCFEDGLG